MCELFFLLYIIIECFSISESVINKIINRLGLSICHFSCLAVKSGWIRTSLVFSLFPFFFFVAFFLLAEIAKRREWFDGQTGEMRARDVKAIFLWVSWHTSKAHLHVVFSFSFSLSSLYQNKKKFDTLEWCAIYEKRSREKLWLWWLAFGCNRMLCMRNLTL